MSDLTPQQHVAVILFKNGLSDIRRAAYIDSKYAKFYERLKELYAEYADQL